MGHIHIYVRVKLSNMEKTRAKEVEALADTGATLTVLPQQMAEELGLSEVERGQPRKGGDWRWRDRIEALFCLDNH